MLYKTIAEVYNPVVVSSLLIQTLKREKHLVTMTDNNFTSLVLKCLVDLEPAVTRSVIFMLNIHCFTLLVSTLHGLRNAGAFTAVPVISHIAAGIVTIRALG